MKDSLVKAPVSNGDICFVKITLKDVTNVDKILNDHDFFVEYLENLSDYKLSHDLVIISDLDVNKIEVQIKCPDKISAIQFENDLNSFETDQKRFRVSLDEPIDLPGNIAEHITTKYNHLLKEHDDKIIELREKLNPKRSNKRSFCNIDEFEKKKQVQETYKEKIDELEKQRKEFNNTFNLIKESLNYYTKNNIKAREEIIRLEKLFQREENRFKAILPIYAHKSEIINSVTKNQVVILVGETGSGKTTQIIQYLHDAWSFSDRIIVCTQPRKVAAVSVAVRVAEEMRAKVGGLVGYQVGMDCKKSKDTSLLFVTDHMLLNECQTDEMFSKYSCIILDEAHERSIYTDLLLGFIKQSLKARPDLKLIVTSATINPDVFVNFFKSFNPPVLQVSGRVFPVETFYETSENDDYLTNAVKKASLLHNSETLPGDILVFLTSPHETELAVRKLSNEKLQNVLILPLHGQLQVAQQREVLLPTKPGLRKIIFATNAAETSVTIPGIRHVIDPGLVKEAVFDSIKNMTSLVIGKTTQSSANQRKGRAGRTESGKCYRLYKKEEFEEMRKNSVPEILRVHLGHSMLKLMMLGVQEPEAFDFVEAPPFASIQAALKLLREIGAVDVNGITEIGKKLAVLNLEPRLGKFSLTCMEEGLGYEGIVICALSSSGNQIFFRGGSNEDKFISDLKKTSFCDDYGDLITLLNVYKKWEEIPQNGRVKWCLENSINSKRIKGASELIEETIQSFRHQLGLTIEKRFSEEDNVNERLTKILFKCFLNNLSRYTGHRKMGFRIMRDPEMAVHIHPSSALTYLEQMPVWVVFQSLLTTSQKYMLNVSYIKDEWVTEALDYEELFSQEDIDAVALEMRQLPSIGSRIQKMLFVKESPKNKSAIEAKICSKDKRICAFLELNSVPHLFLFASTLFINESFKIALEEINLMKEILSKEVLIKPILPTSEIRFVMIQGMRIIALLMNNEFLEVEIENCPKLLMHMRKYEQEGRLEFVKFLDDENKWILTFNDPIHAGRFLKYGGKAKRHYGAISKNLNSYSVIVTKIRRPARGTSFIQFYDELSRNSFLREGSLVLTTCVLPMKADRNSNLSVVVFKTPEWATNELFFSAINSEFHNKIKFVRIVRNPPPGEIESERHRKLFKQCLAKYLDMDSSSYRITFKEPRPEDYNLVAFIAFYNSEEAERIVANINDSFDNYLFARLDLKVTFYTPPNIYNKLKTEVDEKYDGLQNLLHDVTRNVKEPSKQNKDFRTVIETKTVLDYDLVKQEMSPFLSGLPWKTEFFESLHHLDKKHVSSINTCIKFDEHQKCLTIYGSRKNIELTKEQLRQAIPLKQKYALRQVSLRNPEYPKGLMKQIILNYGCDVEKGLKEICMAESVRLILKNHVIKIEGSDEAYDKLIQTLNDVAVQLVRNNVKIEPNIIGECPICLSDVQRNNHFVSESCGHIYCNSCAKQLIKSNIEQMIIPMHCVIENCNQPFMIHDVQNLISLDSEFSRLKQVALKCLQSRNPNRYKFCPTPDCPTVFSIKNCEARSLLQVKETSCESELMCSECGLKLCRFCGSESHSSMICEVNKVFSEKEERELKSWLDEDTQNRNICPSCSSGIEKNGGCNHVECLACKIHICWKCKMTFETSQKCYEHMHSAHQGVYFNI